MHAERLRKLKRDARAGVTLVGRGCRLLAETVVSVTGLSGNNPSSSGHDAPTLFDLVTTHDTTRLEVLLAEGADPDLRHPAGESLLEAAVRERAVDVVELLLDCGADPNATRTGHDSALAIAAFRNQRPSASLLLRAGADPTASNPGPLGGTPLSLAVSGGYGRLCQIMLEHSHLPPQTLAELAKLVPPNSEGLVTMLLAANAKTVSGEPAA